MSSEEVVPRLRARQASAREQAARSGPARLRRFLSSHGPLHVKVGQYLALRPDLIPAAYCDELLELTDNAQPFPWSEARAMICADLGGPPEKLFAEIDPKPLAAASLAQVHVARTHHGQSVAVKVQRPNVRAQVGRELRRLRTIGRILQNAGTRLAFAPGDLIAELERWFDLELDFAHEARNLAEMRRTHEGSRRVRIPSLHEGLSAGRVLTSSLFDGVRFADLLRSPPEEGFDEETRRLLATRLIREMLTQIFEDGLFHADPHPGNLIALHGNVIGFVDFGLVSRLSSDRRRLLTRNLTALYRGDAERVVAATMELLEGGAQADAAAFRAGFLACARRYDVERDRGEAGESARRGSRRPAGESALPASPVAQYLADVARLARAHGYSLPIEVLSLYRALLTAESLAERLAPGAGIRSVGRRFLERMQADEVRSAVDPERLRQTALDVLCLTQEAPARIDRLLADLSNDRFVLQVRTTASRQDVREANRRARMLATAVTSVGLAFLFGVSVLAGWTHRWPALGPSVGGVLVGTYLMTLLTARRLS